MIKPVCKTYYDLNHIDRSFLRKHRDKLEELLMGARVLAVLRSIA
jgi:hypothetical protein